MSERLNKYLAFHLGFSRREADEAISRGDVDLNGETAQIGQRVEAGDTIAYKGKPLATKDHYSYYVLNKPVGYVCSRRRQGDNPTIYELLPESLHHLKPVGRLDRDSSGVLVLSDDGDFTQRMTHPSYEKTKIYELTLDHDLEPLHQQMINDYGITLEDGVSKLTLERLSETERTSWRVIMHEGRNRQIRRTFTALGYTVLTLHRTNFGGYDLTEIPSGKYLSVEKR